MAESGDNPRPSKSRRLENVAARAAVAATATVTATAPEVAAPYRRIDLLAGRWGECWVAAVAACLLDCELVAWMAVDKRTDLALRGYALIWWGRFARQYDYLLENYAKVVHKSEEKAELCALVTQEWGVLRSQWQQHGAAPNACWYDQYRRYLAVLRPPSMWVAVIDCDTQRVHCWLPHEEFETAEEAEGKLKEYDVPEVKAHACIECTRVYAPSEVCQCDTDANAVAYGKRTQLKQRLGVMLELTAGHGVAFCYHLVSVYGSAFNAAGEEAVRDHVRHSRVFADLARHAPTAAQEEEDGDGGREQKRTSVRTTELPAGSRLLSGDFQRRRAFIHARAKNARKYGAVAAGVCTDAQLVAALFNEPLHHIQCDKRLTAYCGQWPALDELRRGHYFFTAVEQLLPDGSSCLRDSLAIGVKCDTLFGASTVSAVVAQRPTLLERLLSSAAEDVVWEDPEFQQAAPEYVVHLPSLLFDVSESIKEAHAMGAAEPRNHGVAARLVFLPFPYVLLGKRFNTQPCDRGVLSPHLQLYSCDTCGWRQARLSCCERHIGPGPVSALAATTEAPASGPGSPARAVSAARGPNVKCVTSYAQPDLSTPLPRDCDACSDTKRPDRASWGPRLSTGGARTDDPRRVQPHMQYWAFAYTPFERTILEGTNYSNIPHRLC